MTGIATTPVTITGTNFTGATSVQFGATNAPSFTIVSDTQITVNAPVIPGAINCQSFQVRVTTCVGTSASFVPFIYFTEGIPVVTSLSQNSGTAGAPITITESGFTGASTVLFGSTVAPGFTIVNDTTITVNVPTIPVANCTPVNVRVQTCVGISQTVVNFVYQTGAPTITNIFLTTGPAGTPVTITGTNFAGAAIPNGVMFGTTPAPILSNTGTTITVNVPTITSVVPNNGPTAGGNSVVITGTNFALDASVVFGANPAITVIVNSTTQITVIAPAGALGTVDIRVTCCSQTSAITLADQYTYQDAPLPPSSFIGCIKKNKFLNGTKCVLQATWTASPSANAVAYRIYKNNTIIATIPATSPSVFQQTLPDCTATGYSITAVNALNQESPHVPLVIVAG